MFAGSEPRRPSPPGALADGEYGPGVTSEPLFYVGLLVIALGVLAAVVKPPHPVARGFFLVATVMFVCAGGLLLLIARDKHRFRVTDVEVRAASDFSGACPATHGVRALITTAGGDGEIALQIYSQAQLASGARPDRPRRVSVADSATVDVDAEVRVASSGLLTAYVSVEEPNYASGSTTFRVSCSP